MWKKNYLEKITLVFFLISCDLTPSDLCTHDDLSALRTVALRHIYLIMYCVVDEDVS